MSTYSLPRDAYELLVEALGEKQKAEVFARALERSIQAIDERADAAIVEKKGQIKSELRDDLRQELVTRELFEEWMKVIDERFKSLEREMNERFTSLNFKLNIFIAIALLAAKPDSNSALTKEAIRCGHIQTCLRRSFFLAEMGMMQSPIRKGTYWWR